MHEKPPFDLNDFRPRMFPPRYIPIVVAVGLLLLGISTSVHRIEAQEVGVVQRFGKFNRILEPGLNFALPFFIENVTRVPVLRQLQEEFGLIGQAREEDSGFFSSRKVVRGNIKDESFMITGDLNAAEIRWVVQYKISDPYKFLFRVRNAVLTFRVMNEALMREIVGDRTINEVITYGRRELVASLEDKLQAVCDQY
ncbi:MAG TPA: protease modulator HflK, partial [Calditrichia bacterium]|nr:protease modulator HflK [Calditrichia bacterium]